MAKRVASQLASLEEDALVEPDQEGPLRMAERGVASDFLVSSLDLRIRVSLLVENDSWRSVDRAQLDAAQRLLEAHPDTDAVVLTVNDNNLVSVVIEPFDRREAIVTPESRKISALPRFSSGPGPLRTVIQEYLRTVVPRWDAVDRLPQQHGVDIAAIAQQSTRNAINQLRRQNYRIPEKANARDGIGEWEARKVQELVIRLMQGEFDIGAELARLGDDK